MNDQRAGIIDLSKYNNSGFDPGAGRLKISVWYFVNAIVFCGWLFPSYTVKVQILRMFGAQIGSGVVIKPRVNIKFPWNISVGDNTWIGEGVWLDSLSKIEIGSDVCISQGAYLLTGNHDYKSPKFDLVTKPIFIESGAWIGARATVCPGVRVGRCAVICVGSILSSDAPAFAVVRGSPAKFVRVRNLREE